VAASGTAFSHSPAAAVATRLAQSRRGAKRSMCAGHGFRIPQRWAFRGVIFKILGLKKIQKIQKVDKSSSDPLLPRLDNVDMSHVISHLKAGLTWFLNHNVHAEKSFRSQKTHCVICHNSRCDQADAVLQLQTGRCIHLNAGVQGTGVTHVRESGRLQNGKRGKMNAEAYSDTHVMCRQFHP